MFRPMHFVLFFLAVAFVASTPVPDAMQMAKGPDVVLEADPAEAHDLEAEATGWGYSSPWRYNGGGWNYGRGGGWNGRYYSGNGWYGRQGVARNYGWW